MTDYDKLKVADLKDLVKERGIASTGLKLKQQFIDALVAHDSSVSAEQDAAGVAAAASEATAVDEAAEETAASGEENGQEKVEEDVAMGNNDVQVEGDGEATNKRKRRSPTPPVREESVSKKLKMAEENAEAEIQVKLPEDVMADAPVDLKDNAERIMPYGSSDDVMDVKEDHAQDTNMDDVDQTGPPSRHIPTRALYVRELVRPLQPNALREHLLSIAQPADSSSPPSTIESFHLDKLRSHALVLFDSRSAATRARTALHGQIWPDEPMRRTLWVDFVPDDKVQDWINAEVERADMTRWEVVYTEADGGVTAIHQQADNSPNASRKPSQMAAPTRPGEGMPNAPSGPRRRSTQFQAPPTPQEPPADTSSRELDDKFSFTQAKPKIYFKPVSEELSDKRLTIFDEETSRDWDDSYADPSAYAEGELRRYTFEDGDRLVDGGADFGLFGRRGRGGGRGGGGGRGRGGDYYRGGPRRR